MIPLFEESLITTTLYLSSMTRRKKAAAVYHTMLTNILDGH